MSVSRNAMTDSQKLDKLLVGFSSLQTQYEEIRSDHEILRKECALLREENNRLKQTLTKMSINRGESYSHCEQLLHEIEDLKAIASTCHLELDEHRRLLAISNEKLSAALLELQNEKSKKCLACRFLTWISQKRSN